jgi:hypothetical protein
VVLSGLFQDQKHPTKETVMPKQLAEALEDFAESQEIELPQQEEAPIVSYICDKVLVDLELPKAEVERRIRNASRVVAVYSDGSRREVQKDEAK